MYLTVDNIGSAQHAIYSMGVTQWVFKGCNSNQLFCNLKGKYSEIPHGAYSRPLCVSLKRSCVNLKLNKYEEKNICISI